MKKALSALLLAAVALNIGCVNASAVSAAAPEDVQTQSTSVSSGETGRHLPSQLDIATERNHAKQFTYDTVYEALPSATSPYAPGALTDEYLQSGLAHLNYIRYAAGLPAATLVPEWNELSQYGATLLASIDVLTHTPYKPADMLQDFYDKGYEATTSSNISYRWGYGDENFIISSLEGCMSDNSGSNLSSLGHRRWLLNPLEDMQVGFGQAETEGGKVYIVTRVFESGTYGRLPTVDYEYVAWPASGNFPSELITKQDPWSVTLNPSLYQRPSASQVSVTITRESDGKMWNFSSGSSDGFFTVNTSNYGVNNCIIFQPEQDSWDDELYDGTYHVTVSGLTRTDGSPATLSYDVDFFDVSQVALPEYTLSTSVSDGGTVSLGAQQVTAGCSASFTVIPDSGYSTAYVSVNGQPQPIQTTYTIERVSQDTEIKVLFQDALTGTISDGTFSYSVAPRGTLTLVGLVDPSAGGPLEIPDEYAGLPVIAIGDNAFAGSTITGTVSIPSSVTDIGENAFASLPGVTAFEMIGENDSYACLDGVLFEKGYTGALDTLVNYPAASPRTVYAVPNTVTSLAANSFSGAQNLDTLYLPSRQISADSSAFSGCELNLIGRTGTALQEQLPSLSETLSFSDIAAEPTISLKNGTICCLNLGDASTNPQLILAGYGETGKLTGVQYTAPEADSVVLVDTKTLDAPILKCFLLDEALVPLNEPIMPQQ